MQLHCDVGDSLLLGRKIVKIINVLFLFNAFYNDIVYRSLTPFPC